MAWPDVAFLVALLTVPSVLALWLEPGARTPAATASFQDVLINPLVLAAGLLLYVCWRISRRDSTAWLTAALVLVGVHGLGSAGLRASRPDDLLTGGWMVWADLATALILLGVAVAGPRRHLPVDPIVLGTVLAGLLVVTRGLLLGIDTAPPTWLNSGVPFLLLPLYLAVIVVVLRWPDLPGWFLTRVAIAMACLVLRRVSILTSGDAAAGSALTLFLGVLGAVLLTGSALTLLRIKLNRQVSSLDLLQSRVDHLESDVRTDRARLHEIGATVAGIASASHLLHSQQVSPLRRQALQQMMDAEIARLQRLMEEREPARLHEVDLDRVLEPLVLAHHARGRAVDWEPSGLLCHGRSDDVAEVVNILLENAAQHGGGRARIRTRRADDQAEILVSDNGAGVPEELRPDLFDWGVKGRASRGQGIGLHIAHRLVHELGGELRLLDQPERGATFAICLPLAPSAPESESLS